MTTRGPAETCEKCGRPHWDGNLEALTELRAEAASLRERLATFEFAAKGTIALKEARATAAEGERDRLRELLGRADRLLERWYEAPPWRDDEVAIPVATEMWRAEFAAIPHTKGEAKP